MRTVPALNHVEEFSHKYGTDACEIFTLMRLNHHDVTGHHCTIVNSAVEKGNGAGKTAERASSAQAIHLERSFFGNR